MAMLQFGSGSGMSKNMASMIEQPNKNLQAAENRMSRGGSFKEVPGPVHQNSLKQINLNA